MYDIIPDPALVRIAALAGTTTATLVICAGILWMLRATREHTTLADLAYADDDAPTTLLYIVQPIDADAPTQVIPAVEPIRHGFGALPHAMGGHCYDGCDNSPCPDGHDHQQCVPACLTAPGPYRSRHHDDTVDLVPIGWTPVDAPEPTLVRPYLDDATIEIGVLR